MREEKFHAQLNFLKNDPSLSFRVLTKAEFHLSFLSSSGMDPGHRWEARFRDDLIYDVKSLSYLNLQQPASWG